MKHLSWLGIVLFLFASMLLSCNKEDEGKPLMDRVTVIGIDTTLCTCCGGYIVAFHKDSLILRGPEYRLDRITHYRIYNFPEGSGINESSCFPIIAEMDWKIATDCGTIQRLEVLKIRKISEAECN